MPVKVIRIRTSSISGKEIKDGQGAVLRLRLNGKRYRADLTTAEVRELIKWSHAEEVKGRKGKGRRNRGAQPAEAPDTNEGGEESSPEESSEQNEQNDA